ncbi:uncharacterized protein FIESC28_04940 [Fusarium coffeatum]|uniref:Uncharacterized protein n=1 Tax=Fusarium coffeatum TaxID=231269 RepID=A0A366RWE6_9HYPO|nr:uncharacterized protein FIESC28_04940 [Fusarium coffeatum]RBR21403.1 hypothetical protein FIESC28_04940 [Fusarium coffeatum]
MNPFQKLPNEIIDAIFTNMHPANVWRFQQSAKSSERALDPHLRTRRYALDQLIEFGCKYGNNRAVRKALSLGADVSVMTVFGFGGYLQKSTILSASLHLDTVTLLFDLGARLDISPDRNCHGLQKYNTAEFFKLCSDRGARDQFDDFQSCIDRSLLENLPYIGESHDDAIDKVSMLMELGANPTKCMDEYFDRTAVSKLIADMEGEHYKRTEVSKLVTDTEGSYSTSWGFPVLELLLSSEQLDLNSPSLWLTEDFLKNTEMPPSQVQSPIAAAVRHMAVTGSTQIMDMLLEAGAKLNLPVHASLQPLLVYADATGNPDGPGYDYLCSHGATFEQTWHPEDFVEDYDSRPIFLLCSVWNRPPFILDVGNLGVITLFIERGAVKDVEIRFIKNSLRPMMGMDHEGAIPFNVIARYHFLLKLVLRDANISPSMSDEMNDLLREIVAETTVETTELGLSLDFSNIVDPVAVALLLERGAKLNAAVHGSWTTQDVRHDVASKLEKQPYFIVCNI